MTLTPNKNYNNQSTGSNVNTWGIVLNSNFSAIDLNLAGRLSISVAGSSNITVTANQAENLEHILSGVLTGSIQYIFPAVGGFYMVENGTTGAFSVTIMCAGGTVGAIVPQGMRAIVFVNPDDTSVKVDLVGSNYSIGTATATGGAAAQIVTTMIPGPYLLIDGTLSSWVAGFTSTGAMTLALGGTAAKSCKILTPSGYSDTLAGSVVSGSRYLSTYDAANNVHVIYNPTLGTAAYQPISAFLQPANNLSDVANPATALANLGGTPIPSGLVIDFAGATPPAGWLLCYGQAVSRTTYAALFTAIGTAWGIGDGTTTFNIPDGRGRVRAGLDNMGGSAANRLTSTTVSPDGNTLNASGGEQTHLLTITEMPSHSHVITTQQITGGVGVGAITQGNASTNANYNTNNTGGDGVHNNVQPTLLFNVIIKT